MIQTNNTNRGGLEKKLLKTRIFAAGGAIVIGMAIMAAKFYAWHLTGSSAILSDALESIINVVAGGFALAAIIASARPPDQDHPYGHGKIEFFSAGFEGALIILAAFGIFKVGFTHLLHPQPLPHLGAGLLVLLGTAVVNLLLGIGLWVSAIPAIYVGRLLLGIGIVVGVVGVSNLLRGGHGMHGGHQALGDAPVVMQHLGDRRQAVGGA